MTLFRIIFSLITSICIGWAGEYNQEIDRQVAASQKEVQSPQSFKGYISILDKMNQTFPDQSDSIKQYCQNQGYALWPHQETWKQVLISEIFYPRQEIEEVYEGCGGRLRDGAWILVTRPVMERLAISAKNGNPIAALYLGHAFTQTCDVSQDICSLAHKLYEKAFQIFEETASRESHYYQNRAKYFLASEYCDSEYICHHKIINDSFGSAINYLTNSSSREAHLLELIIRTKYQNCQECPDHIVKPTLEEFLDLGYREQYPVVFLDALYLFNLDFNKKIQLLEQAIQTKRHPALYLKLFSLYKQMPGHSKDALLKEKMLPLLKQAGEMGSPIAYREMAALLVPYKIVGHYFEFKEAASLEDLKKCEAYLQRAAELDLPEAFYNLALLTQEYHERLDVENPLPEDAVDGVEASVKELCKKAAQRGFWSIHDTLKTILNSDDEFFADYSNLKEEKLKLCKIAMCEK